MKEEDVQTNLKREQGGLGSNETATTLSHPRRQTPIEVLHTRGGQVPIPPVLPPAGTGSLSRKALRFFSLSGQHVLFCFFQLVTQTHRRKDEVRIRVIINVLFINILILLITTAVHYPPHYGYLLQKTI